MPIQVGEFIAAAFDDDVEGLQPEGEPYKVGSKQASPQPTVQLRLLPAVVTGKYRNN